MAKCSRAVKFRGKALYDTNNEPDFERPSFVPKGATYRKYVGYQWQDDDFYYTWNGLFMSIGAREMHVSSRM